MINKTVQTASGPKLRIALECRTAGPRSGVGSAILALAHAFSESDVADQEYTFIVDIETREWLGPHIFGPSRMHCIEQPALSTLKTVLKDVAPLRALWKKLRIKFLTPPSSDGYVESEHFDIVHFISQNGYKTALPTIYQPHDLQHLHYPDFFSEHDLDFREKSYRALCDQAAVVCVQTEWCKHDVVEKLGIPTDKVTVVKWGCVLEAFEPATPEELQAAIRKLDTPSQFFLYPAVTWPHKNHECILRALAKLRDSHDRIVHVCFTGQSTEYRSYLEALADQLDVTAQVHYLGFVTAVELQALFLDATAMIYPSKFEGFGLPILEAFRSSLPVICARSSCLPEVAQDAAIYFDPSSPDQLASCVLKMLDNPLSRSEYIQRGHDVLSSFSFKRAVAEFQYLYRRVSMTHQGNRVFGAKDALRIQPDRIKTG